MDKQQEHWKKIYRTKLADAVSWFHPRLERSLALIAMAAVNPS